VFERDRFATRLKEAMANAEGYRDGYREGLSTVLIPLLVQKFGKLPEHYRTRLATASPLVLDEWAERVLADVATLEQVFAEPSE
jgi:hypothetical protein